MRSGQCRWCCPLLFVCPRLAHPYVCLSGWVSAHKKKPPVKEGTEKVGTFQHFLSRGKNQELAKSKTVDLASFHFVQSISSRYRNLGRIRAQWQYSRYNKESPFSSNAVSA